MYTLAKLREFRQRRFMSQGDLAEKAGVSRATIGKAEQGHGITRYVVIRKLAAALDVDPSELMGPGEGQRPNRAA